MKKNRRIIYILLVITAVYITLKGLLGVFGDIAASNAVLILAYHRVGDYDTTYSISKEDFEQQIRYLKEEGYNPLTLTKYTEIVNCGGIMPKKSVIITFDDGYWDNLTNALPIVHSYGYSMVVYVVPDYIGKYYDFLQWEQLAILANDDAVEVGSHTLNHKPLAELDYNTQKAELLKSKILIEENTKKSCDHFAYPFGSYNCETLNLLKDISYKTACTGMTGLNDHNTNLYLLRRTNIVKPKWGIYEFKARILYSDFKYMFEKYVKNAID